MKALLLISWVLASVYRPRHTASKTVALCPSEAPPTVTAKHLPGPVPSFSPAVNGAPNIGPILLKSGSSLDIIISEGRSRLQRRVVLSREVEAKIDGFLGHVVNDVTRPPCPRRTENMVLVDGE
jgi:hypothetical protein